MRSARRSSSFRRCGGCGWWHRTERTRDTALERGRELLALAERLDDPALLLEGHHALWPVLVWLGKADAARRHLDRGMALYDKARHRSHAFVYGGHDPGVCCRKVASWAFVDPRLPGPRPRGERRLARAGQGAGSSHEHRRGARLGVRVSRPATRVPGSPGARACPDRAVDRARSVTVARGGNDHRRGRPCRARRRNGGDRPDQTRARGLRIDRGATCSCRTSFLSWAARARRSASLTRVCASSARRWRSPARRVSVCGRQSWVAWKASYALPRIRTTSPKPIGCFRRAIEIARGQAARSWELRAASSLARLLVAAGRRDEARRTLADVYDWFTEGFDTADLGEAKALLDDLTPT